MIILMFEVLNDAGVDLSLGRLEVSENGSLSTVAYTHPLRGLPFPLHRVFVSLPMDSDLDQAVSSLNFFFLTPA